MTLRRLLRGLCCCWAALTAVAPAARARPLTGDNYDNNMTTTTSFPPATDIWASMTTPASTTYGETLPVRDGGGDDWGAAGAYGGGGGIGAGFAYGGGGGGQDRRGLKGAAPGACGETTTCAAPFVYDTSDDDIVLADMTIAELRKRPDGGAWNCTFWRSAASRSPHRIELFRGEPVLKVFHPRNHGASGSKTFRGRPVVPWGVGFDARPAGLPADGGVALQYRVFFAPGWSWSRGGKMHGLVVGHGDASGGRRSPLAASFRVMWQEGGGAIAYLYLPHRLRQSDAYYRFTGQGRKDDHTRGDGTAPKFGTGLFGSSFQDALRVGRWNTVKIGLTLNTFDRGGAPRADGAIFMSVNGRNASFAGIRWRAKPQVRVEAVSFGTFAGGPDPQWSDGWQYFKDFALFKT